MSPIDKAVEISKHLAQDNSYLRPLLMTAICHGLEKEEISKMYNAIFNLDEVRQIPPKNEHEKC
tara:strand:+ start:4450 stop:4641 length:192 start_codon:yes stop_codon:yes gene_type:complete